MENFSNRVPLLDIRMFVSSVLLQRQTGGNLSEILVRLAYIIRERFKLKGQVRAASAHGRMTALILSILPLVMIFALLFVAPGYLQGMAADSDGKWMIAGAVVAQFLGYYVMRRIVDIKVKQSWRFFCRFSLAVLMLVSGTSATGVSARQEGL
jgi:tight adherence protein B